MKLYIIVLKSLSVGLKCAQACHAMHAFTRQFPEATAAWEPENNVVVLEHAELSGLADVLDGLGLCVARFHEPDMGDALTAICVEPAAKRMVRGLSLAA